MRITGQYSIRQVRKWGDPVLIDLLGASVNIVGVENFQTVKLASILSNGAPDWNDVAKFQKVDNEYLRSLQYDSDGYTVTQKTNWLGCNNQLEGRPSRPYWRIDNDVFFGTMVFGGQMVLIDPTPVYVIGQFPNRTNKETITLYRLRGLCRSDFAMVAKDPDEFPFWIQHATEAGANDEYNPYPRGVIRHVVWSAEDFPPNIGNHLYIAEKFLV
jgi:hypothetical protein